MNLSNDEILIHDGNYRQFVTDPLVGGDQKRRGLIPRDFTLHPVGSMLGAPKAITPKIPRSEWSDRVRDMTVNRSRLSDIRNVGAEGKPIPSRDQNGYGYCVPPGTPVLMADGTQKAIEQIKLGEEVIDSQLEKSSVTQLHTKYFTGDMVSLRIDGLESPLIITQDHLIRSWRSEASLKKEIGLPFMQFSGGLTGDTRADILEIGDEVFDDKLIRHPIRSIARRAVDKVRVFDIGVDRDHYFFVNNVLVHNCWAHSTVSAALLSRAADNQPYADLSAYAIACMIKGYKNQGGWNGESMRFLRERGCPTSKNWPQQGTKRDYDNPATWEEAAKYKDTEWEDIEEGDFDQQFTFALLSVPCPLDLNWWSHSICAADPVDGTSEFNVTRADSGKLITSQEFDIIWQVNDYAGAYGLRFWNSWGEKFGVNGMGVLTESRARNNGSIALRVMRAAA